MQRKVLDEEERFGLSDMHYPKQDLMPVFFIVRKSFTEKRQQVSVIESSHFVMAQSFLPFFQCE